MQWKQFRLIRKMKTPIWKNAIEKDTKKAKITYKLREDCKTEEVQNWKAYNMQGYYEVICHIIFDVQMDFT